MLFKKLSFKRLDTKSLLFFLKIICWLLIIGTTASTIFIITNDNLSCQLNSNGFNNALTIFRFPISFLIALLAVLTLHVTLQRLLQTDEQLLLLNKQISATRQPNLFVDNRNIWVYTFPDYPNEKSFIMSRLKDNFENKPDFLIWNVGLATAIQVRTKFEFNIKRAVELIEIVDENKLFEADYSIKGIVTFRHKNSNYQCLTLSDNYKQEDYINFIPSIRDSGANRCLFVPKTFIELYLIFLSLICNESEEIDYVFRNRSLDNKIQEFPNLSLTFCYLDIGNVEQIKKFKINIKFDKFQNPFAYKTFRQTENYFELNVQPSN